MEQYIQWGMDQNNEIATNTIAFVDEQLRGIADSLVVTEYKLEQFQQKNFSDRIFISEDENNMQEVIELEEELTQRSIQREYYSALIKTVQSETYTAFPSAAVFGFQYPNVDLITQRIQELVQKQRESNFSIRGNHVIIEQQLEELKSQKQALLLVAEKSKRQVNSLIDSLTEVIAKEEQKVMRIPQEQRQYFNLRRENKLLSDLYTFLLNKR